MDLGKLYLTQISITEWFEKIGHSNATALRKEDNEKRERLKVIKRITGMPFDEPHQFPATDIATQTPVFKKFLKQHGDELCALRLLPHDPALPKLRLRGKTVRDTLGWFKNQSIDPTQYMGDFVPHSELPLYSTIFVINQKGIFGEIVKGGHYQLTQGFYEDQPPVTFSYDWNQWQFSSDAPEYAAWVQEIIQWLYITEKDKQKALTNELDATFHNNYLAGYFETITNEDTGLWFIDYNRLFGDALNAATTKSTDNALVKGRAGSPGTAAGSVRIVMPDEIGSAKLKPDEILVCKMTTPDYLPLMQQAAAIVTDLGGVLSHAAIIARELKKPCVTGTGNATLILKDGKKVIVNGSAGSVFQPEELD